MSKSIYDEALKELKIVENDLEIINGHDVSKIKTALEQAQKQEKLLELYREKDKYIRVFTPLPKVELDKYRNIVKQIKELENE